MAQITALKDKEGKTLYPITSTQAVVDGNGVDLETRMANAENSLKKKADTSQLSNVLAVPSGDVPELPELPDYKRLFVDMWNRIWGEDGAYDPDNAPDPEHSFLGNKIWMTYEEAIDVYNSGRLSNQSTTLFYAYRKIRTHLPVNINSQVALGERTFLASDVEAVNARLLNPTNGCFKWCSKLKSIFCWGPTTATATEIFDGCSALEDIDFANPPIINLSFKDSPLLSENSINNIIRWLVSGKTVTVHAEVYAKLTDENNAEWNGLLALAASKNIIFATA